MLAERLDKRWQTQKAAAPIDAVMRFTDAGLVLGAGTALAPTGAAGRDVSIDEREPRLLALLAAAHLRTPSRVALTHLRKAAESWNRGEDALAAVHLTLSRLDRLAQPDADAKRLFLADSLLREGVEAHVILKGLGLSALAPEALARYSPDQPRVPAGSGRSSGEWTSGGAGAGRAAAPKGRSHRVRSAVPKPIRAPAPVARPPSAASPSRGGEHATASAGIGLSTQTRSHPAPALAGAMIASSTIAVGKPAGLDLGALSRTAAAELAAFLARLTPALSVSAGVVGVAVAGGFGLSLIPFPAATGKWVSIPGPGNISYFRSPDVPGITFRYTDAQGVQQEVKGVPGPDDNYRGPDGQVLARIVKTAGKVGLIISTAALLGSETEGRQICPVPSKDRGGPLGQKYEDYMKARLNPGNPTPTGMAYAFPISRRALPVLIDDCEQKTGALAEYKGPNYEKHYLKKDFIWGAMLAKMISQSQDQIDAKGRAPLTWYFAEKPVADFMRDLFNRRGYPIRVVWAPFKEEGVR